MWIAKGEYCCAWHLVMYADRLFYFAMAWLFLVVFVWAYRLSKPENQSDGSS